MRISRVPLTGQILIGMVLGIVAGTYMGAAVVPVGVIGTLLIQAIKVFATPLLFFAIVHGVVTTHLEGRHARRMLGVAFLNACIALTIGLLLSNTLRVGDKLAPLFAAGAPEGLAPITEPPTIEFGRFLTTFVPTSVVQPFNDNIAVTVILMALLLGFALRRIRREPLFARLVEAAEGTAALGLRVTEVVLGWIIML